MIVQSEVAWTDYEKSMNLLALYNTSIDDVEQAAGRIESVFKGMKSVYGDQIKLSFKEYKFGDVHLCAGDTHCFYDVPDGYDMKMGPPEIKNGPPKMATGTRRCQAKGLDDNRFTGCGGSSWKPHVATDQAMNFYDLGKRTQMKLAVDAKGLPIPPTKEYYLKWRKAQLSDNRPLQQVTNAANTTEMLSGMVAPSSSPSPSPPPQPIEDEDGLTSDELLEIASLTQTEMEELNRMRSTEQRLAKKKELQARNRAFLLRRKANETRARLDEDARRAVEDLTVLVAAEKERVERERVAAAAERERVERERADKERAAEKERADKERAEKERAEKERADKERADKERAEKERADKERIENARKEETNRQRLADAVIAERARKEKEAAAKTAATTAPSFAPTLPLPLPTSQPPPSSENPNTQELMDARMAILNEFNITDIQFGVWPKFWPAGVVLIIEKQRLANWDKVGMTNSNSMHQIIKNMSIDSRAELDNLKPPLTLVPDQRQLGKFILSQMEGQKLQIFLGLMYNFLFKQNGQFGIWFDIAKPTPGEQVHISKFYETARKCLVNVNVKDPGYFKKANDNSTPSECVEWLRNEFMDAMQFATEEKERKTTDADMISALVPSSSGGFVVGVVTGLANGVANGVRSVFGGTAPPQAPQQTTSLYPPDDDDEPVYHQPSPVTSPHPVFNVTIPPLPTAPQSTPAPAVVVFQPPQGVPPPKMDLPIKNTGIASGAMKRFKIGKGGERAYAYRNKYGDSKKRTVYKIGQVIFSTNPDSPVNRSSKSVSLFAGDKAQVLANSMQQLLAMAVGAATCPKLQPKANAKYVQNGETYHDLIATKKIKQGKPIVLSKGESIQNLPLEGIESTPYAATRSNCKRRRLF